MEEVIIKANSRNILGSAESRRLRKSGFLPATITNKDKSVHISIDQKEFDKKYFDGKIFSSPITLEIDGKNVQILASEVDIHPVTDRPIHADFNQIDQKSEIKAKVKIKFTGQDKSTALKRGGFLHINARMVEVICKNIESVPETIDIDISEVKVGEKIRSDSVSLPENIKFKKKSTFLIASILGKGGSKSNEEAAAVEESGENADSEANSVKE